MKVKAIAKRMRRRAAEFRLMARTFAAGDTVSSERARWMADVLEEVALQISPKKKRLMQSLLNSEKEGKA